MGRFGFGPSCPAPEERVDLKQPVSTRSSILLGELIAIKIALESIKLEMEKLLVKKLMLFSDSQCSGDPYSRMGK